MAARQQAGEMTVRDKLARMAGSIEYCGLSVVAALFMGAVRSMLSNIPFVYERYYCINTLRSSMLIAAPTGCGMLTAAMAVRLSKTHGPDKLLSYGMTWMWLAPALMFFAAFGPDIWQPAWLATTLPCAVMSGTGFFSLPAMQVLVLQDFKDMSGFAAGISKLVMTLTSTLGSMILSYFYSGRASPQDTNHSASAAQPHTPMSEAPTQPSRCPDPALPDVSVFLSTLGGFVVACLLVYWLAYYIPTRNKHKLADKDKYNPSSTSGAQAGVGAGAFCCDRAFFGPSSRNDGMLAMPGDEEARSPLLDVNRGSDPELRDRQPYADGAMCCDGLLFGASVLPGHGLPQNRTGINALRPYQWAILLSIATLGPFSSDAYLPAFPQIQQDLHTTGENISLTMQINWIVLALANPLLGYLADRVGRKATIIGALLAFTAGALGCAFAKTFPVLMAARIVQGFGQAVGIVTFAVIRDLIDDGKERMQLMSTFSVVNPIMIMLAPVVGGGVVSSPGGGWRNLFFGLAGWGVLTLLAVFFFIPETRPDKTREHGVSALSGPNSPPVVAVPTPTSTPRRRE